MNAVLNLKVNRQIFTKLFYKNMLSILVYNYLQFSKVLFFNLSNRKGQNQQLEIVGDKINDRRYCYSYCR